MIVFLSDLHTRYEIVERQVLAAEAATGTAAEAVVVLGDFGLFEPQLSRFFRRRAFRFPVPVYLIEGNHEDFEHLDALCAQYADCFTHLPRATVHTIAGWRLLALGGVAYMDAHTTPMGSVVRPEDIDRCLLHPPAAVDVIVTHDCPTGIGVANSPGFEHCGPPGLPGSERLVRHFEPPLWIFGHHHRWFDARRGRTEFHGLAQSWCGCAVLSRMEGYRAIPNPIPPRPSWTARLWQGLARRSGRPADAP